MRHFLLGAIFFAALNAAAHDPKPQQPASPSAAAATDPVSAVLVQNARGFETGDLAMLQGWQRWRFATGLIWSF